jgi:DNA repair ATPase RecN
MTEKSPAPGRNDALARLAGEVAALRESVDAMATRFDLRLQELAQVQDRLEASENLRRQLAEQMQHVLELLGESRTELNALRQRQP